MEDIRFSEVIDLYRQIVRRFEKIEGRPWGPEGAMMELSKQVGGLANRIMIQENYYYFFADPDENKIELADELADILGQVIRIADHYDIDLLRAHLRARKGEDETLRERGV